MLPAGSIERLRRYGSALDRLAPGTLTGLYAVGSIALGDYRSSLSNFDVVAVADTEWSPEALAAAGRAARVLGLRRRPARVGLVTWDDLAQGPGSSTTTCLLGTRVVDAGELLNPLTWQILRTAAVCARGPEYPELWSGDLRAWAAARLTGHWSSWLPSAGRRAASIWLRSSSTDPVLEATRLVAALRSGRVMSKVEAGSASIDGASSRSQRILKDAVGFRSGASMSMYWGPFERRNDALLHIGRCVEEAALA
jgi:hypothetical protein